MTASGRTMVQGESPTLNRRVVMRGNKLAGLFALGAFAMVGGMVATDPAFAKVDVDKFTIGGEARIRYEYRVGATFGPLLTTWTVLDRMVGVVALNCTA